VEKRIPRGSLPAVALSGGIDSGLIAQALARRRLPFMAYTLVFKNQYSERDRIERLSKKFGFEVRSLVVEPHDVLNALNAANAVCSEPVGPNTAIMRIVVMAAAQDGARTIFDGDGADRLFLGMNRYRQYLRLISVFRKLKAARLAKLAAFAMSRTHSQELIKAAQLFRAWNAGVRAYPERVLDTAMPYDPVHEAKIYHVAIERFEEEFQSKIGGNDFGRFFTFVSSQMCPEMFFQAPAEMQELVGICPAPAFWDDELVSMALSLPLSMKLRGAHTKYILRKCAAELIDSEYALLPKIGLQSANRFLLSSEAGRTWQRSVRSEVKDSADYRYLLGCIPGGQVDVDRLIPLHIWRQRRKDGMKRDPAQMDSEREPAR
jgi:asparagine synthetase B (glutamine-hydrolysing)